MMYFIVNINTLSTFFTFVFVKDPTKLLVEYNLEVSAHFMSFVTLWHDALKSIVSIYKTLLS